MSYTRPLALLFFAACGGNEPAPSLPIARPDPATPPSIEEPVRTARPLALEPSESAISVVVVDREQRAELSLATAQASMALLFAGDVARPSGISINIADVALAHAGVRLTNIEGTINFDNFVLEGSSFDATADLRVTWSLANAATGSVIPIRPLELRGIEVHGLALIDDHDRAHFTLDAFVPGVVFEATNLAQLADLSVALTFTESR